MNFWKDKHEFWRNKLAGNDIYARQKAEAAKDIIKFCHKHKLKYVVDLGGYKGELGEFLKGEVAYSSLDIVTGFDITDNWEEQGHGKLNDVLYITNLTLIALSPEDVQKVTDQMKLYGKHFYLFEERIERGYEGSVKINNDYGGKWHHIYENFFDGYRVTYKESQVNPKWDRIFIEPK